MELTHTFTVPATVEDTWAAFNDLESVAGCFPGATVTSVEGDDFKGSCKVKLGPIALVYSGTGSFVERDDAAHRFVMEAKGKDKRGNGTAGATVTAVLTGAGDSTDVEVVTDLSITGKPAQFGRGMIQDVSDKLLRQFVACLEDKVGGDGGATATGTATPSPGGSGAAFATSSPAEAGGESERTSDEGAKRASSPDAAGRAESDDALDLGATVLPVLIKAYWRQILGAVLVLWVLKRLLGGRR